MKDTRRRRPRKLRREGFMTTCEPFWMSKNSRIDGRAFRCESHCRARNKCSFCRPWLTKRDRDHAEEKFADEVYIFRVDSATRTAERIGKRARRRGAGYARVVAGSGVFYFASHPVGDREVAPVAQARALRLFDAVLRLAVEVGWAGAWRTKRHAWTDGIGGSPHPAVHDAAFKAAAKKARRRWGVPVAENVALPRQVPRAEFVQLHRREFKRAKGRVRNRLEGKP